MSDWQPIKTQKWCNRRTRIRTAKGREFDATVGWYAVDEKGDDCCAWAACNDWEAPDCWSDGICWSVNEDGVMSDQPTHWCPALSAPEPDFGDKPVRVDA